MKRLFKLVSILSGTLYLLGVLWSGDCSIEVSDHEIMHGIKK
tara:strand:- start:716 stop:841 length:126 start_codon:yes stop_codon:yes gene_type:complete